MATTTPDNIQYPVNSDQVAPLASHFKNLADSTQAALNTKVDDGDARLSDERTPLDNSVTSAKIVNGTIVSADIADGTITGTDIASTTITEANLAALDYVKFDTTYSGGSTQPGMINWNDVDGTLEFKLKGGNVTLQIGQEQVVRVKNNTGSTIANGSAVYISGSDGNNLRVTKAQANSHATSIGTLGVATEDLVNGNGAYVTTFGLVRELNTSALTEGAPVYLSPTVAGGLTSTRPPAPAHSVTVGFCLRSHAVNGALFVRVDTGNELDELHNVLITSPTNGQALTYDNGLWKNATPVSSLAGLSDVTITDPEANEVLKYDGAEWVNGTAAGGVTAAATAPDLVAAKQGDAWFDTNDGTLYVCYIDPDSTKQWVQVQANSALEGSILARLGSLESQAIAFGALSPNYVINGAMDVWQRGTSIALSAASMSYTADRWMAWTGVGMATTVSRQAGPTGIQYSARVQRNSGNTATSDYNLSQPIETINSVPLAGKTVTVSFWMRVGANFSSTSVQTTVASGTGSDQNQYVGFTGGSTVATSAITPTTSWQRFSITGAVSSSATQLGILFKVFGVGTAGANDWFEVSGVQLEVGNTVTSFRRNQPNIQAELAACQRYYYRWTGSPGESLTNANFWITDRAWGVVALPVTMRVAPTINYSGNWHILAANSNMSCTVGATSSNINSFGIDVQTTGGIGTQNIGGTVRANVISGTSYVQATAEL